MKRGRVIFSFAATACVIWILIVLFQNRREPVYNSKPLSYWVTHVNDITPEGPTARMAVYEIGAPAVPYLIKQLERRETLIDRLYAQLYPGLPAQIQNKFRRPISFAGIQSSALTALRALGPTGSNALPAIVAHLTNTGSVVRAQAAWTLGDFYEAARPAKALLVSGSKDASADLRIGCFYALQH